MERPTSNLLVLDTSTDQTAVGVWTEAGALQVACTAASQRHGRDLLPIVQALLREAGIVVSDLNVVAVGLGPGSYTGLRVGLTAAKVLAYLTGAHLVGFDSLEGLAWNAPSEALRINVVADAQRGDVYTADFQRSTPGAALACTSASRIRPLSAWAEGLQPPALLLGPGLDSPTIRAAVPARIDLAGQDLNRPRAEVL